ncbi:MAG: hypothetical protein OIF32_11955 [Campylobacterales bacterium]|nr:hypothetical protein [Campylobacterales bacterium]
MKTVVENNTVKSSFTTDLSSSDSSGNESDTGLTIAVKEEKPTKNKNKVTATKEIKHFIEKDLLSSDDEKPIKKRNPRKGKRLLKKEILLHVVVMDKITKNQSNQKKLKRKS